MQRLPQPEAREMRVSDLDTFGTGGTIAQQCRFF